MPSSQQVQSRQQQQLPAGPTRWCPTPEQLMILEEMYRGGLRTPNASQIQQITAHLSSYGRIEGKNVFYWFQNHKARDRQKLRRRLCMSQHLLTCAHQYYHGFLAAGVVAPPVTLPVAPPPYGVFDQAAAAAGHQLLAPTSPTPAAYGYYYPTAFAASASPASRCGGGGATTPPSPNQLFNYHHHQGGAGGIIAPAAAESCSLGKLDNFGVAAALDDAAAVDMAGPPGFEVAAAFCRPLKTLDLFPGGIKEEQHDVA
ncbi:hypothetical protein PR202_gb25085 [Eleusine coracana subsp. coracana]|uniref:Homeobox domain-containing protein n=1 Tax=Eleusine coracana subsp. coracana TaxID=191504 RepID=A0AAV5FMU0_ELECO|nr:hypothetical protein QOZ80_5BG0455210 [Eleusine coracana subsp. coracana]GJN36243.1 hypothetical protein PR202_gb25085 [Eleusine coracana subsp. coracana]